MALGEGSTRSVSRLSEAFGRLGEKHLQDAVSDACFFPLAFLKDRKSGRTALHLAAEEANLELIRLFLELPSCLSFVNAKVLSGSFSNCTRAGMTFSTPFSGL